MLFRCLCAHAAVAVVGCAAPRKAAADRRRLFPEGELRETLDEFTDAITKRQRNPGGLMAPPSRSVRVRDARREGRGRVYDAEVESCHVTYTAVGVLRFDDFV